MENKKTITRLNVWEKVKNIQTAIQLFLIVFAVGISLLGIWIDSLTSPLEQRISQNNQLIAAQDQRIDTLEEYLVRIEAKLDRVIESN